ncbi:hypothetical protein K438DRAFT_2015208, partial [Mycena galopus ATCC 62051]
MSPTPRTIPTSTPTIPNEVTTASPSTVSTLSATDAIGATFSTLSFQAFAHTKPCQAPPALSTGRGVRGISCTVLDLLPLLPLSPSNVEWDQLCLLSSRFPLKLSRHMRSAGPAPSTP